MNIILAIDPGTLQSGWVLYDAKQRCVMQKGIADNLELINMLRRLPADQLVVEMIASYGMPVGRETFETCLWIGRFIERWEYHRGTPAALMYRKDVKMHLCGSTRGKDPHVWQALLDKFGPGKDRAVGKKSTPGPLFGVTSHTRAALAVAVTFADRAGAA